MIDWIHLRAKEWGRWQAKEVNGWPARSLLARIRDEGSVGAAIKQHYQPVPIKSMPRGVLAFHRAWMALDEQHRQVVAVFYGATGVDGEEKARMLGLSRSQMYASLDAAHVRINSRIDDEPVSGLSGLSGQNAVNRT